VYELSKYKTILPWYARDQKSESNYINIYSYQDGYQSHYFDYSNWEPVLLAWDGYSFWAEGGYAESHTYYQVIPGTFKV
jgi:hypothetical protein